MFLTVLLVMAGAGLQAQMQAVFGYSTFYLPDQQQPYVETYLQFDAWTMRFDSVAPASYRATAEVTIALVQQDSVCYFKKYDLASPTVSGLDKLDFSFLDVQRFSARNGVYDLTVSLRDKGSDRPAATVSEKLVINYTSRPSMSSLQLMAGINPTVKENMLSRGGYDMEPYVSDFVPERVKQMNYYYELYNFDEYFYHGTEAPPSALDTHSRARGYSQPASEVQTIAFIEKMETGQRAVECKSTTVRRNVASTVPVFGTIDISELPSGNYNLVCEVRDLYDQLLLYKRVPFYRSNPGVKDGQVSDFAATFAGRYSEEELNLYLDALYPIASEPEKTVASGLVRKPGMEEKQAFLYRFWQVRNPMDPEGEWLRYKERIDYVQAHFSYPRTRGIQTDRGRVYLQYGPPDFIRDEKNYVSANRIGSNNEQPPTLMQLGNTHEGSTRGEYRGTSQGHVFYLPYQLWRYNKLETDDPNRVFLFWDEHRSGYYTLLNSNARGEVQDPGWERRLCRQQLNEGVVGEVGEQFNRGY